MTIIATIETDAEKVAAFIKAEIAKITGVASTVEADVESASGIAIALVNGLKTFIASPVGKDLETIISNIPGVGPYLTDILNFLPTLVTGLGWAKSEFTKSPEQVVIDGLTAATNVADPNIKASNLITIAGHIITLISTLQKAPVTIQTAISSVPAIYAAVSAAPTAS